ncbi:RHS repeat domain-containing protein [Flavobacterium suncheonense]|uniref:RHS repeat domain-containing protein n=1 Tax=Flavobacterium suncheonense TaxID=350894 RepID=UPI003FA38115
MRTKLYKSIVACFFMLKIFGQSQTVSEINMPNYVMPSPQGFEMMKYGSVPTDESTGRISPSIPIYTYNVGGLNLPISINYSGIGVKVEQKASWTGVNWILNAGGMITRTVRDLPDETDKERVFYSYEELQNLLVNGKLPEELAQRVALSKEFYDSEGDEFHFNFQNYSGSFVLVKLPSGQLEPRLVKYDKELKIEILGDFSLVGNYEFKITTPDGTSYFFGGMVNEIGTTEFGYATEETQFVNIGEGGNRTYGIRAKTGFYLTKIESYLGDIVYLEYYTRNEYETFFADNQQRIRSIGSEPSEDYLLGLYDCYDGGAPVNGSLETVILKNIVFNGKFLKRIWSPQSEIEINFLSSEVYGRIGHYQPIVFKNRILTGIDYTIGKIDFEYLPSKNDLLMNNTSNRDKFFLETVTFKSSTDVPNEVYKLEYNDPLSIPNSFSTGQDYLGYYNGKIDNPTLLPQNSSMYTNFYLTGDIPSEYLDFPEFNNYLGDRSTSFEYATKGVLTKIYYPTGGFSKFEYEPIIKDKLIYGAKQLSIYSNKGNSTPPRNPNSILQSSVPIGFDLILEEGQTSTTPPLPMDHEAHVALNIDLESPFTNSSGRDYVYVSLKDYVSNSIISEKRIFFDEYEVYSQTTHIEETFSFNLEKDGQYIFTMGFGDLNEGHITSTNVNSFTSVPVEVSASINYVVGVNQNDGTGIRVKRVCDFDSLQSNPSNIRRYYYKKLKDVVTKKEDKVVESFKPLFHSFYREVKVCHQIVDPTEPKPVLPIYNYKLHLILNSNSVFLNSTCNDVLRYYPEVTISIGGDNFESGAIEKKFRIETDADQYYFGDCSTPYCDEVNQFIKVLEKSKTNFSDYNGSLLKEVSWVNKDGILFKIKQDEIAYEYITAALLNNICGKSNGSDSGYPKTNYYFGLYTTNSHKLFNKQTVTKEYIENVPLTKYITPPFELFHGWQHQDHDGDGINNEDDEDFITPEEFYAMTEEQIEEPFKKMVTIIDENYSQLAGLPSVLKKTNSTGGYTEVKNYYVTQYDLSLLSSPTPSTLELFHYHLMRNRNRISEPVQIVSFNNSIIISKLRNVYKGFLGNNRALKSRVLYSKGDNELEERLVFSRYDEKGNPTEIFQKDGTPTVYIWSFQRRPIYKIENATYDEVTDAMNGTGVPEEGNPVDNPFIISLPNSRATIYNYNEPSGLLESVIDPNGLKTSYEYDSFNRLKRIKDYQNNIIQEFDTNYRPQN